MPGPIPLRMQQVHLGRGPLGHLVVNPTDETLKAVYASEHAAQESILLKRCPADIWPGHRTLMAAHDQFSCTSATTTNWSSFTSPSSLP